MHDGELIKNKVHDSKDYGKYTYHRDYKARQERYGGKNAKIYPNLIAEPLYNTVLKKVEAKRKKEQQENKDK